MKRTTLCYIRKDGHWLMLYRNKKPHDPNAGKWIGIGGRLEPGETPDDCNAREVREETGLVLRSAHFHGVIHFRSDAWEDEDMYLYSSEDFIVAEESQELAQAMEADGTLKDGAAESGGLPLLRDCDEGELSWIPEDKLLDLPMWEGDRLFLTQLAEGRDEISMTLRYEGETLVSAD